MHLRQGDRQWLSDLGAGGTRGHHAQARQGVAHGGTYTAHPVSLAAAEKTLEILAETDALERIAAYGTRLRAGKSAILKARGIAHSFVGHPSMSGLYFAHDPPRTYRDWKGSDYTFYDAVAQALHDECILCEPDSREPWFVSAAHDEACLKDTLDGLRGGGRSHARSLPTDAWSAAGTAQREHERCGRIATMRSSWARATTAW